MNGSLVWTEDDSTETKYIQALGQIWAEVRTEATVSKTYYHHTNHLGTTEAITDESGTVIWDANFSAYGEIQRSNGTEDFTASYTGKQLDADTGLYYFNARWYDSKLGRFISEDPIRNGLNWIVLLPCQVFSTISPCFNIL